MIYGHNKPSIVDNNHFKVTNPERLYRGIWVKFMFFLQKIKLKEGKSDDEKRKNDNVPFSVQLPDGGHMYRGREK